MRIHIKTTVNVPEIPVEVQLDAGTLNDVLAKVFGNVHFAKEVTDPATGEMKFDGVFEVRLNDEPYYGLPRGLNTELHDGDTIALSFILLGGG